MKKTLLLLSFLIMMTSCFKTAEQIKREKMVDQQMYQSSKIIADLTSQVNSLKGRIAQTSGKLEEFNHNTQVQDEQEKKTISQTIQQLQEQVNLLSENNLHLNKELSSIKKELASQKKYIKRVTGSLSRMAGPTKKSSSTKLARAHINFEKGKNITAKSLYLEVLSENKINAAKKNGVFFNLGLIEYKNKKYEDAIVYFSKIYTKYPRSSYASRSLLYIARSFKKLNKKDEANATFQEVINKYPKSKQVKFAKKEMVK